MILKKDIKSTGKKKYVIVAAGQTLALSNVRGSMVLGTRNEMKYWVNVADVELDEGERKKVEEGN